MRGNALQVELFFILKDGWLISNVIDKLLICWIHVSISFTFGYCILYMLFTLYSVLSIQAEYTSSNVNIWLRSKFIVQLVYKWMIDMLDSRLFSFTMLVEMRWKQYRLMPFSTSQYVTICMWTHYVKTTLIKQWLPSGWSHGGKDISKRGIGGHFFEYLQSATSRWQYNSDSSSEYYTVLQRWFNQCVPSRQAPHCSLAWHCISSENRLLQ